MIMIRASRISAKPRDHGGAAIEFSAVLPSALIIIFLAFQALMASTTVERVENAARTGARAASQAHDAGVCGSAATGAMPSWLNDRSVDSGSSGNDGVYCHVRAKVPLVWPGVPLDFTVNRTVHMPMG
jgi:Flp pilus assembly protein TadG